MAAALALLFAAVFLAWSNSFQVPFLMDDQGNIVQSPSIRRLWPLGPVLFPPVGSAVGGRPLFNLSFALNHAVSGFSVWSYHLFNVLVHALSAWALFGLARRTFLLPSMRDRLGRRAGLLALAVALPWALHPLHTDAVTYISQRAEAMMGLFFLALAWLAVRGWESERPGGWHALSALAFLAGVGVKEVIVALPPVMLAYEWTFFGRKPLRAVRNSPVLYAGYGAGLGVLALLVAWGATLAATPQAKAAPLAYLATQAQVIVHYLGTAFWPSGLCFDYEWPVIGLGEALPYAAFVAGLLFLSAWLLVRRKPAGFLGAWFFLILAPTSSILPLPYLAWDRRMVLPLAALAALVAAGGYRAGIWLAARYPGNRGLVRSLGAAGCALAAAMSLALGVATWDRNRDFATDLSIWRDTAEKRPQNPRAWISICRALAAKGRYSEAVEAAEKAVALDPESEEILVSLSAALKGAGKEEESIQALEHALKLAPGNCFAHYNLSVLHQGRGDLDLALEHARIVHETCPRLEPGRVQYARVLAQAGRLDRAFAILQDLNPAGPSPEAAFVLAGILERLGNLGEARQWYEKTLERRPGHLDARFALAEILARQGRVREAEGEFRELVRRAPEHAGFRVGLARVLTLLGRDREAGDQYRTALSLDPENLDAALGLAGLSGEIPEPGPGPATERPGP